MGPLLLVVHIAAAVLFLGPATVASSLFPGAVPVDPGEEASPRRDGRRDAGVARVLHRISRVYGALALVVPVAGLVLGLLWARFGEAWLIAALGGTVVADVLYGVRIVPAQAAALAHPPTRRQVASLHAMSGVFALLWVVVLVLMVLQPGAPDRG